MEPALVAFGLVFVAELGDKSQLVALSLAARHRGRVVVAAIVAAAVVTQGLSAAAGGLLGSVLDGRWPSLLAGVLFCVFAVITWLDDDEEEATADHLGTARPSPAGGRVVVAVTSGIVLAELGDKTMLVTVSLASRQGPVATWIGAAAGMAGAGMLAIAVGRGLRRHLPAHALRIGSAVLFAVFGVLLLASALR